ncbi:hypothetical protein D3C71_1456490 [compost metagenome]
MPAIHHLGVNVRIAGAPARHRLGDEGVAALAVEHLGRRGHLGQRRPQAPGKGAEDFRLAARPALQLDTLFGVLQGMIDIGLERVLAPAAEHPAAMQRGMRRRAIRPLAATLARLARQGGALAQADHVGQRHHADHRRSEQHRIEQHRALKQLRLLGQHQAAQDPAETVADGKQRHLGKVLATHGECLQGQLGAAVPAMKTAAMIAVAMALDIAQPEVEILGQPLQQGRIDPPAITVAVEKMQQRLARRRRIPAAQGETGGTGVGPGF